ncbi:MAG TPA: hypothetical protein VGF81_01825 [Solirubrobacteraceae bacterium]
MKRTLASVIVALVLLNVAVAPAGGVGGTSARSSPTYGAGMMS